MTALDDILADANAKVHVAHRRLNALRRFNETAYRFDPGGQDYVTIWLRSTIEPNLPARAVPAARVTGDDSRSHWIWWSPAGNVGYGTWDEYLDVTFARDAVYPIAVRGSGGGSPILLTDEQFDPRTPTEGE